LVGVTPVAETRRAIPFGVDVSTAGKGAKPEALELDHGLLLSADIGPSNVIRKSTACTHR